MTACTALSCPAICAFSAKLGSPSSSSSTLVLISVPFCVSLPSMGLISAFAKALIAAAFTLSSDAKALGVEPFSIPETPFLMLPLWLKTSLPFEAVAYVLCNALFMTSISSSSRFSS